MNIGRLDRKAFAVSMLVLFAIIFAIIVLLAPENASPELLMTFGCVDVVWMIFYIGRLHDVGYSGWWSLLVIFTGLLGLIALAAFPGNKGANKYGEVPPSEISHLLHFWRAKKMP